VESVAPASGGLSIIIPAWNEEDRLVRTLDRYLPSLESRKEPFEVIVVADGDDHTSEVAQQYADRNVKLLRFPNKLGKGGAILEGMREARYDVVGYVDADGPISPEEMHSLVGLLGEVDCVIASRWIRGASGVQSEPLFNRFAGRVWNLLTRSLLFLPIRDTQCGAKFFKRTLATSLLRTVHITNRAFDVAVLFHVKKSGHRMLEVPVRWKHDPSTRMPITMAIPVMFLSIVGLRVMNSPLGRRVPPRLVRWLAAEFGGI